jgi:hypothetical protein
MDACISNKSFCDFELIMHVFGKVKILKNLYRVATNYST